MRHSTWSGVRRAVAAAVLAAGAAVGAGALAVTSGAAGAPAPPMVTSLSPASGPTTGGTVVTVTGTGFTTTSSSGQSVPAVTAVAVGSTPAPDFDVVSDTELLLVTPPLPSGLQDVSVTTAAGATPTTGPVGDVFTVVTPGSLASSGPCPFGSSSFCLQGTGGTLTLGGTAVSGLAVDMQGSDSAATGTTVSTLWSQLGVDLGGLPVGTDVTLSTPGGLSGPDSFSSSGTAPLQGGMDIGLTSVASPGPCLLHEQATFTVTRTGPTSPSATPGVDTASATLTGGTAVGSLTSPVPVGNCASVAPLSVAVSVPVTVDFPVPTLTNISPVIGPCSAGTTITVYGTDFGASTPVTFAGQPGVDVVGYGDWLTADLPDLPAGTTSVTVQIGTGPPAATTSATYTCQAPPTVTGISPDQGPITGGTVVRVIGTGFVPGYLPSGGAAETRVSFGGDMVVTADVVSPTELLVAAPATAAIGPVDVTVTTSMGTSPTSGADRFTYVPLQPPASCLAQLSAAQDLCVTGTGGTVDASLGVGISASLPGLDVSLLGDLDAGTGAVTVPAAGTALGQLTGMAAGGLPVPVTLDPAGPTTGSYDAATGALSLSLPLTAGLDLLQGSFLCQGRVTLALQGTVTAGADGRLGGTLIATGSVPTPISGLIGNCPTTTPDSIALSASLPVAVAEDVAQGTPAVTAVFPTSGPTTGFTLVWAFGQGLTQPTAVELGGTRVLWRSFGPSLVLALAPPALAAGPVDVRVTTAAGTSPVAAGDVFTYTSG